MIRFVIAGAAITLPVSRVASGRNTPWFRTTGGGGMTSFESDGADEPEVFAPDDDEPDFASRSAFSTAASPHFFIMRLRAIVFCMIICIEL